MTAPSLVDLIRAERAAGRKLRDIAEALGISYAFCAKLAKRKKVAAPRELRGGWRGGKRKATEKPIDPRIARRITALKQHYWRSA